MGVLGFVGDILNSKAAGKKVKADYNSEKQAWDQKERARYQRCVSVSQYMGRYLAQKGYSQDTYNPTDAQNCPPPDPYTGNAETGVSKWGSALKGIDSFATRAATAAVTGGGSEVARAASGSNPYKGTIKG
jgi:hypothetical protein